MQFSAITDQISFIGRKKRQRDVFWDLAQNQTRFLYNVAFRYVGNRYDAEDLVQETLYAAYNESPRRKRTGYQSGIKSGLYLGGHVVSPQTPLPRIYLTASG